jgi:hypothetical protein
MSLPTGQHTDFDFLHGTWHVANRRLRQRLVGCQEWDEFDGIGRCEPWLDGQVNVDDLRCPDYGLDGMAIRTFDAERATWSIHWINGATGRMEPPVIGGFDGPIGTFVGDDVHEGRPVTVRFTWTVTDRRRPRWSQAFSSDGEHWEVNWTMDFRPRT